MRRKQCIILIFVFLPSLFYISEPINASVSLDDFAYDNYIVYDQSGKYPLANLTFIAQLIYDNESHIFYLDQKVSLEIISTPLTEHWGLKSFNFTTEKVSGFWSINSTHMRGTFQIPYAQEEEYEVNLNSEIETRQEIIPPAYLQFVPIKKGFFYNVSRLCLSYLQYDGLHPLFYIFGPLYL